MMYRWIVAILLFAALGCAPKAPEKASTFSETWRPKSSLTRAQAETAAWTLAIAINAKVYSVTETHSMEPILWGNFFVIVEKVDIKDIKSGDIVLWRPTPDAAPIIHTCLGNVGGRLTIKGYNNFNGDNDAHPNRFITAEMVVGRYVGHIIFDPTKS